MRTTLTIDDALMAQLKEIAHREHLPLKQVIERAIRGGLKAMRTAAPRRRYRMTTHSMGMPRVANLDRALAIVAALEDEEIAQELERGK